MRIYIASFSAREKDWGTADKQERWMVLKGLKSRLLSYYAIVDNQAESARSFESWKKLKR